ncbi:Hpt domain-containing protein [Desulforhopalus sp. IMCC35007]|uniref:Hpt domain-containing protein n=1 Tax=Desulforhopalus sp. IMCC35007 TaxID=2569543 RepID=UPI0010AEDF88|nr:Hpt domain-containing protein [Desulforhopalus sp. IMCC35007]TKB10345.1 Hpt domain-containing protein [Desulforhopalus sp. IMCC35007]
MTALDWDKAFAMEQAADDAELLEELLEIFKDSFKTDVGLIEQGINEKDALKISAAAHSIKGAAASLGIQGINDVALGIEMDSRSGGLDVAAEKLPHLQELMAELLAM